MSASSEAASSAPPSSAPSARASPSRARAAAASAAALPCHTCGLPALPAGSDLKSHSRSALHELNLRRRVADLPPVSAAALERHTAAEAERRAAEERAAAACVYICDACHKSYDSAGQFETHVHTRKHVARVKELLAARRAAAAGGGGGAGQGAAAAASAPAAGTAGAASSGSNVAAAEGGGELPLAEKRGSELEFGDADGGGGGEGAGEDDDATVVQRVSALNCLFCFAAHDDIASNLEHMRARHSFFVPDVEFLTDAEGLLEQLLGRVVDGHCLLCKTGSAFSSPQAAQQHMLAKAHCRFAYETEAHFEDYCEFYDYAGASSSGSEAGDGEDEEEDEEEGEAARGGGGEGDAAYALTTTGGRTLAVSSLGDLLLPRGGRAAPRHLMRYYRQRLGATSGVGDAARAQLARLALDYADAGVTSSRAARALEMGRLARGTRGNRVDARAQRAEDRYRHGHLLTIGMDMNQIRRKYFKVQILV